MGGCWWCWWWWSGGSLRVEKFTAGAILAKNTGWTPHSKVWQSLLHLYLVFLHCISSPIARNQAGVKYSLILILTYNLTVIFMIFSFCERLRQLFASQGDVKLTVITKPHAHFVRRGVDLVYTHKLGLSPRELPPLRTGTHLYVHGLFTTISPFFEVLSILVSFCKREHNSAKA